MKKKSLILLLSLFLLGALCACGDTTEVNSTEETVETAEVETPEEEANNEALPVEETEEEVVEEAVLEEPILEEPEVEMVDFETWAKQEDNDEVCLVHWNEELGIQEIMPTAEESQIVYEIQNGDRFAVPFRSNIETIQIYEGEKFIFENSEYVEIPIEKDVITRLYIFYLDESGEKVSARYAFK